MDLRAELYRATHVGNAGDEAFYSALATGERRVLELGSGAGRILAHISPVVDQLVGLEKDRGLLELARKSVTGKNVVLLEGDMREVDFEDPFDLVLLPYSGIYCLESLGEAQRCIKNIHSWLKPGGGFALDAYAMDEMHLNDEHSEGTDELEHIVDLEFQGQVVPVFERSHWSRATQTMEVIYEYRFPDGSVEKSSIQHHYLLMNQLRDALFGSGFESVEVRGSFDGAGYDRDSEHWVVIAQRAE